MAKPPTPGKVVKETHDDEVGVTEWTLSNGVRVVVKPTDFENDAVAITGWLAGRHSRSPTRTIAHARFADEVVGIGGVGDLDADALEKVLAGKSVSVSTCDRRDRPRPSAAARSPRDLETMFQLIHLR